MSYKIAVASTDGKVVNQHFGRADQFYIIEVNEEDKFEPIELRKLPPICQGGDHDEAAMQRNVKLLSDCEFVLVSRIGHIAENALNQQGISVYIIPDIIENAVAKLISYVKINKMISDIAK
jgi:nitrogen fixation protein NifX